jgi:predicted nucleotidyltransferase
VFLPTQKESAGDCFFMQTVVYSGMNQVIQVELEKLKNIIITIFPVDQIYLFGSYAYGSPHKDSDLDLFVVLKDEVMVRDIEAAIVIRQALSEHQSVALDLIVTKKSQYLERKTAPTLERKIAREGILLYAA